MRARPIKKPLTAAGPTGSVNSQAVTILCAWRHFAAMIASCFRHRLNLAMGLEQAASRGRAVGGFR